MKKHRIRSDINKMRDTEKDPPPEGSGDVRAYHSVLKRWYVCDSRDVRGSPSLFPRWRPLTATETASE